MSWLSHGRNGTYAPPRRPSSLRLHSNPRDTRSGPSQLPGQPRRHLVLGAPPKAGGWRASLMSGKDSADGARCEARGPHSKCSKFLAGQKRGCWVYLFIFGGEGGVWESEGCDLNIYPVANQKCQRGVKLLLTLQASIWPALAPLTQLSLAVSLTQPSGLL